ncbi:MAG TPA: sulfatase-like hydrolase/transferase, partial [bacterium]|nr:sulfatase-like hydrolase/transferase [bacterium]
MDRRKFLKLTGAGLAAVTVQSTGLISGCAQPARARPNIILILADDLGWNQVGCYDSDYYETPNIDRLASQGMRLTDAYAACPVCSPTRASIMTGKYPARLHITDFIAGGDPPSGAPLAHPDWQKYLPLEEVTIAEALKKEGYATAEFGKWHLSIEKTPPESLPYNPDKQGFDESFVTYKPVESMAKEWQTPENDAHNVHIITEKSLGFIEAHQ